MKELEKYKTKLVGKKLIKVLHSDQGEGIEHLNGLGNAYYFSTVLELENGERYRFGNDWIDKWDESEKLIEVTHLNWGIKKNTEFNNIKISDLIIDGNHDIYIKLENDILIYHTIDYGDKLFFNKYSELFDSNGKLKNKNTVAYNDYNTLWQRVKTKFNL